MFKNFIPEFQTFCDSLTKALANEKDVATIIYMIGSGLAEALNLMEYIGTISYCDGFYYVNYLSAWQNRPEMLNKKLAWLTLNQATSEKQAQSVFANIEAIYTNTMAIRDQADRLIAESRADPPESIKRSTVTLNHSTETISAILDAVEHFCNCDVCRDGDVIDEVYQCLTKVTNATHCALMQLFARATFLSRSTDEKTKEYYSKIRADIQRPSIGSRSCKLTYQVADLRKACRIKPEDLCHFKPPLERHYCIIVKNVTQ